MKGIELEVKILNIDVNEVVQRVELQGGYHLEDVDQQLYTYDFPTIAGRFCEILGQINNPESKIALDAAWAKMRLLGYEIDNLIAGSKEQPERIFGQDRFAGLLTHPNRIEILNSQVVLELVSGLGINKNKWIRLRKTNNRTTLAVKHILAGNARSALQQMMETEIEIDSFEDANQMLEQLGFYHKSFQEKRRSSYMLDNHELDIDYWPGIPPYLEVEGTSEDDLSGILKKIGFRLEDAVSCAADEVYRMYGMSMFESGELRF